MVFLCLGKPNKNPDFDETFSNRELTTIFQTSEAIDWSSPFWKLVSVFCFIKTPLSLVGFILYCFFSVYITLLTLLLLIIHYVWFYVCVTCAHLPSVVSTISCMKLNNFDGFIVEWITELLSSFGSANNFSEVIHITITKIK